MPLIALKAMYVRDLHSLVHVVIFIIASPL